MSKSADRGSLIGLKASRPLPSVAPVATTSDMERLILGGGQQSAPEAPVRTSVFTPLRPARKEPTVLMNAKLPLSLHSRLKRTAQFNDVSMTDILIQALETELATGKYAVPPETWGSDLRP